uniref:Uncharacterized protein n=1 Tax=Erpetoichthys calabaricus TaxID=27687 RepID=A0A8C4XC75_ERPCA
MAEAQLFGLQDEITCSVCLDSLSDPISILCGHSFCLKCLTDYWDQSQECSCPQCRRTFTMRPELHRNTLTDPVRNLKEEICAKHHMSLEIFCKTDETCICVMCVVNGHSGHKTVELETEREEKQVIKKFLKEVSSIYRNKKHKQTQELQKMANDERADPVRHYKCVSCWLTCWLGWYKGAS